MDNRLGMQLALAHLLEKGKKKIAHIAGPDWHADAHEDNWVSVYSSAAGTRYGLVEFDLSSLAGTTAYSANLKLYMPSAPTNSDPINQDAYIIDCSTGTPLSSLTWNSYTTEKDATKISLDSLGSYSLGPGSQHKYYTSTANLNDLQKIQSVIDSGGKLSLVFIAKEDGNQYRTEWEDEASLGNDYPMVLEVKALGSLDLDYEFQATSETWIREQSPTTTYENDLMSVWSSYNTHWHDATYRRYGLCEFDISQISGLNIGAVQLDLNRYSNVAWAAYPIKQSAHIIDSTGTPLSSLTWNLYQSEKDSSKTALETLGDYDLPSGGQGQWFPSNASVNDILLIESEAANNDKKLSLVFIADEDGTEYRADWSDNGYDSNPPKLRVNVLPPTDPNIISSPAENVTASSARLSGQLIDNGGWQTNVFIYWGDNDGGTNPDNWDNKIDLDILVEGSVFNSDISALTVGTDYYFRCSAQNLTHHAWSPFTRQFTASDCQFLGDIDHNCQVDLSDFVELAYHWLQNCGHCDQADFDDDQEVNLSEMMILAESWLSTP